MTYKIIMRWLDAEEIIESESLSDCPALVRAFILNNDLSASRWISGDVYKGDRLIQRLAFNGRAMT